MRIRSIKPEFWRSPDISDLRIEDRLLFIGLWSYVDDNGVGQDRIATVCADLFADDLSRDPRETFARVSEGLERLSEAGRIVRYTVDNRDYLAVENWSRHQRIDKPNKARYPRPDAENSTIREPLAESSRESREIPAPGTGEQGNRGSGEQGNSSSSSEIAEAIPDQGRPEVESLCNLLCDLVEANGSKRPKPNKQWRDAARLMIDKDGHTPEQIAWIIRWSQNDEFWRTNVMAMPTVRKQFDQLRLKAMSKHQNRGRQTTDDRVQGGLKLAQWFEGQENGNADAFAGSQGAIEGSWV